MQLFILHETASGYCLFQKEEYDETGGGLSKVQKAIGSLERFSKMVKIEAYQPFKTAEEALENQQAIAANNVSPILKAFLTSNLPASKSGKKQKFALGIVDAHMGAAIFEETGITASFNEVIVELIRGIRTHFAKIIKKIDENDLNKAQLGLSHSFSRFKCAQDVNRQDKPIMQSIALLEQMDKDINTFCMRLKEWFAWHFPEMTKIVNDNHIYSKIVCMCAGDREFLTLDENKDALVEVTHDETKAQQIIDAARISMGMEMSEADALQVTKWAQRVEALIAFRESLVEYLQARMTAVAPNLQALIGEQLGAKLITHAGGLTNLSKYPASTIQILGAEKALFRALKTKGATPKYGLIFNSTFIGRAGTKNKGKISRYLANKLAIASRVDCFSEAPTNKFGIGLKNQVEERLKFLASGGKPRKNKEAMAEVIDELKAEGLFYGDKVRVKKQDGDDAAEAEEETQDEPKKDKKDKKEKKEKKEKKDKKRKHESSDSESEVIEPKKKRAKK